MNCISWYSTRRPLSFIILLVPLSEACHANRRMVAHQMNHHQLFSLRAFAASNLKMVTFWITTTYLILFSIKSCGFLKNLNCSSSVLAQKTNLWRLFSHFFFNLFNHGRNGLHENVKKNKKKKQWFSQAIVFNSNNSNALLHQWIRAASRWMESVCSTCSWYLHYCSSN